MALDAVMQRGKTRVIFGAGSLAKTGDELDRLGLSRVVVVVTPGRKADGEKLASSLGARVAAVLPIAREHVPREIADEGASEANRVSADAVVAMGGGSAIGLAKAIALATAGKVAHVAVPTTYSGSEMTSIWGLTEGHVKRTGRSEDVRARLVVYDPSLTLGLPLDVSIASAWNAMAHAVEALWAPELRPDTQRAAVDSIAGFARALPRLLAQPRDPAVRSDALEASYLAGVSLAEASMGLHHKICHVLGGRGMPHAPTHAALLPHVVRFNRDAAPEAMARIAGALAGNGANDASDARDSRDATAGIFALASATHAPSGLASLGLHRDAIDDVVRDVLAAKPPNPRPLDAPSLRALLLEALEET